MYVARPEASNCGDDDAISSVPRRLQTSPSHYGAHSLTAATGSVVA
jgi:hypothetical protein